MRLVIIILCIACLASIAYIRKKGGKKQRGGADPALVGMLFLVLVSGGLGIAYELNDDFKRWVNDHISGDDGVKTGCAKNITDASCPSPSCEWTDSACKDRVSNFTPDTGSFDCSTHTSRASCPSPNCQWNASPSPAVCEHLSNTVMYNTLYVIHNKTPNFTAAQNIVPMSTYSPGYILALKSDPHNTYLCNGYSSSGTHAGNRACLVAQESFSKGAKNYIERWNNGVGRPVAGRPTPAFGRLQTFENWSVNTAPHFTKFTKTFKFIKASNPASSGPVMHNDIVYIQAGNYVTTPTSTTSYYGELSDSENLSGYIIKGGVAIIGGGIGAITPVPAAAGVGDFAAAQTSGKWKLSLRDINSGPISFDKGINIVNQGGSDTADTNQYLGIFWDGSARVPFIGNDTITLRTVVMSDTYPGYPGAITDRPWYVAKCDSLNDPSPICPHMWSFTD